MTNWRLPCPNCDSGYRKMHTDVDKRTAARALDVTPERLDDDSTWVRCNNCREIHAINETREFDVQGGIGI